MNQESYNESEENMTADAFAPENFQKVILIQTMRIYDLLLAILAIDSPQKAEQLALMHEQGLTFTPAPAFSVEEE